MKYKIGIVGLGFVGTAVETGLQSVADIRVYDKYKDSESLNTVVENSKIIFVCLPTPMQESGHCDTSIVEQECLEISRATSRKPILVIKSTVPPGTTERIGKATGLTTIFNPEFLTEKNFINDFLYQDRIMLGASSNSRSQDVAAVIELYEDWVAFNKKNLVDYRGCTVYQVKDSQTAELLKYGTNSFLSTKVAFFNEIYDICQAVGVDFNEVVKMMLLDKRIGTSHTMVPGPDGFRGFGGKCLPKDTAALIALAKDLGVDPLVLDSVWAKNLMVREEYDWENIKGATTECSYGDDEEV